MIRSKFTSRRMATILAGGSSFLLAALSLPASAGAQDAASARPSTNASLNIAPLRVEFDADARAQTVRLSNTSDRVLAIQSRLFAWSQEDGEDAYGPANDLSISPSIVSIPPGETQIVRLMRRSAPSEGEKRFRLAIDQLPDPALTQGGEAEARLRFTLPVFLDRDTAVPSAFEWHLANDSLKLTNFGGQTARIVRIEVSAAGNAPVAIERNTLRYVHGGAQIAWPMQGACALGPLTVVAHVDGETINATPERLCG